MQLLYNGGLSRANRELWSRMKLQNCPKLRLSYPHISKPLTVGHRAVASTTLGGAVTGAEGSAQGGMQLRAINSWYSQQLEDTRWAYRYPWRPTGPTTP